MKELTDTEMQAVLIRAEHTARIDNRPEAAEDFRFAERFIGDLASRNRFDGVLDDLGYERVVTYFKRGEDETK